MLPLQYTFKLKEKFLFYVKHRSAFVDLPQGADPEVAHTRYAAVCNPEGEPLAVLWEIDEFASEPEVEQELFFQLKGVLEG